MEKTYLDEVLYLQKIILQRKVDDIKLRLNIAQNPHTKNPREFFDRLNGVGDKGRQRETKPKLDKVGFENLKAVLDKNPRFRVK